MKTPHQQEKGAPSEGEERHHSSVAGHVAIGGLGTPHPHRDVTFAKPPRGLRPLGWGLWMQPGVGEPPLTAAPWAGDRRLKAKHHKGVFPIPALEFLCKEFKMSL